jgi:putative MATE family efflux protein
MNSSSLQLDTGYRQILALALPISLALVIPFLNVTVNNYFLGQLGESELGTAGITSVFYLIVAVIGNGLNSALQSLISRKAGEDNRTAIGIYFGQGIRIALLFSILAIAVSYFVVPSLFNVMLKQKEVRETAVEFIFVRIWGLPFLYLYQSGNALLVGTTNARFLAIGTLAQAGSNIVLDYLFIFGHAGFPELGFQGAAWASVFSEIIGMLVVLIIIIGKKLHLQFGLFSQLKPKRSETSQILTTSAPLILQYSISLISWFIFYSLLEHRGERALAISNIMRNVFILCGIFTWAFGSATNTLVSNTIGQKKEHEVLPLLYRMMQLSFLFAFGLSLLLNLFSYQCLGLFGMPESFIREAEPVLRMVTAGVLLMSISITALNAITGTGNTTMNLIAEIAAIVVYIIYCFYVIEWNYLGLSVAWASELVYWAIILSIALSYMRSDRWKKTNSASRGEV